MQGLSASQTLSSAQNGAHGSLDVSFLAQLPIAFAIVDANGLIAHASDRFSTTMVHLCGAAWKSMDLETVARCLAQSGTSHGKLRVQPMPDGRSLIFVNEQPAPSLTAKDALTGLPGRDALRDYYNQALLEDAPTSDLALLLLDLDRFKAVNDTLGHPIGDGLLCRVVERLRKAVRSDDILVRLGGDEFAIIQRAAQQPGAAEALAQRLIDLLSRSYLVDEHLITIGVSVGIAFAADRGQTFETQMKNADLALYAAKANGRGCYRLFEQEMDERAQARRTLELELRKALALRQFELAFQPQVRSSDQQLTSIEALLQWRHPTKGTLPAESFIAIAEETGLVVQIGEWVLRSACREAQKWPVHVSVAVNLSHVQFSSRGLPEVVASALAASGLQPSRLELEITEGVLLKDTNQTLETLHQLKGLGVRITMDQFGTGYSSLNYLRSFPFDKIKIDHSFARDMASKKDAAAIVSAVSALGASLGISVTADGVETEGQCRDLKAAGCTELQGHLFGEPLSSSAITKLIARSLKSSNLEQ